MDIIIFLLPTAFCVIMLVFWRLMEPRRREKSATATTPKKRITRRDIEAPLLANWEERFRESLGPVPEIVSAKRAYAVGICHDVYAAEEHYYRAFDTIGYDSATRRMIFNRMSNARKACDQAKKEHQAALNRHYLLPDDTPVPIGG